MKKILAITAISMLLSTSAGYAQKKKSIGTKAKNTAKDVGTAAKEVGNKTAEVASKGASKITDQVYKGKTGPDGQTIYIDNKSKYYWVDDKGHHQYITAAKLKDKPKD